jgi:glycerophosphoryl diester phosphodiesterase
VLLSSFNPIALRAARRRAPEIPLGLLVGETQARWTRWAFPILAPHQALHPHESLVRDGTVRSLHRGGRKVVPWTVNRPERIRGLLTQGVDALITDDPQVALEVRDGVA